MTEQTQDQAAPAPQAIPVQGAPQTTLSPEQFDSVKKSLIDTLNKNYGTFINSIMTFPALQGAMQEAFKFFDTGYLWMERALALMPMPQVHMGQAPLPVDPQPVEAPQTPDAA